MNIRRENTKNVALTLADLTAILALGGLHIPVNNLSIYQKAFIHRSYLKPNEGYATKFNAVYPLQDECNETYEFLGDTILNSVIGCYLYERFYTQNEGFLTKTRTKMVRSNTLGELGRCLHFDKFVIISQHVENENGRFNVRILEDLFESFIAAIYLDNSCTDERINQANAAEIRLLEAAETLTKSEKDRYVFLKSRNNGYNYCKKFVMTVYENFIDIVKLIEHDDNYKDQLQHYYQQTEGVFPTWHTIKEEGKTNNRWHTVGIKDRFGYVIGVGKERKKTDAEQLASKNALVQLGIIPDTDITYFKSGNGS
jgi:dsRNA-specific ribonuclease